MDDYMFQSYKKKKKFYIYIVGVSFLLWHKVRVNPSAKSFAVEPP